MVHQIFLKNFSADNKAVFERVSPWKKFLQNNYNFF